MLNTQTLNISQDRFNAAAATEDYLRHHGASLCNLLDALDDENDCSALYDLYGAFGRPIPDADAVEVALRSIHRFLMDQAPSQLDRVGQTRNLPASDMTRWHGARVSELLARFRHAG